MIIRQRITIVTTGKPRNASLNDELQWFGTSLGLFGERDRDKSCFRLFLELIKAAKHGQALSSDELAESLDLSRGTVVHHINALMERGLVIPVQRRYTLRERNLEVLLDRLRNDFEKAYKDLETAAKEIDRVLGM